MKPSTLHFDIDIDEWVLATHLGKFYGETPDRCYDLYHEDLRVAAAHARHNPAWMAEMQAQAANA